MRATLAGAVLALIGLTDMCLAAPPPVGSEDWQLMSPYRGEIERAEAESGARCCDWGDGRPVEARRAGQGWQVRFREGNAIGAPAGVWLDVPEAALVLAANPVGVPIAWWRRDGQGGGRVVCFWRGVEG